MKKFFLIFLFCISLFALSFKAIVGYGIKFALKRSYDCELAFRSMNWKGGELVFTDLVLFDPSLHIHIEKASLRPEWRSLPKQLKGHLNLLKPHVVIRKAREIPEFGKGFFDFSFAVQGGTLEWGGPVQFNLEHVNNRTLIACDWEDSSATLLLNDEKIEADLHNFHAPLLTPWVSKAEILQGGITGRIVLNQEKKPISANLKLQDCTIVSQNLNLEELEGTLSYNELLGAKWELLGKGVSLDKRLAFSCDGRGFFESGWIETNVRFSEASCQISGDHAWIFSCSTLNADQVTLIQGAISTFYPEIGKLQMKEGTIEAKGEYSLDGWALDFIVNNGSFQKDDYFFDVNSASGHLTHEGGELVIKGEDFSFNVHGLWERWQASGIFKGCDLTVQGGWDGEKLLVDLKEGKFNDIFFSANGWIDPEFDLFFKIKGSYDFAKRKIDFSIPHFAKEKGFWKFDFRVVRSIWDTVRICGTSDGKTVFYEPTSHILGSKLQFNSNSLFSFGCELVLSEKQILSISPMLKEWNIHIPFLEQIGTTNLKVHFDRSKMETFFEACSPEFSLDAKYLSGMWKVGLISPLCLDLLLDKEGGVQGVAKYQKTFATAFEGKIDSTFRLDLALTQVHLDLDLLQNGNVKGVCEGQGHLIYDGQIDADFDFTTQNLMIHSFNLENIGQIHLNYSSLKGVVFDGIHLHGPFDCVVDLVQYDLHNKRWVLQNARVHLPFEFLTHPVFKAIDPYSDLEFTADFDIASDFSMFSCRMQEGMIPFNGAIRHFENLAYVLQKNECDLSFRYLTDLYRLHVDFENQIQGRAVFGEEERPLTIDWEYKDFLIIQSIYGSFAGLDAAFHADNINRLVGSAKVDFSHLSRYLPLDVAKGFQEVKMGKNYELKGRLKIIENLPYFTGILSGKQIEFFGFQFRTLLAEVDLSPKKMRIFDLKISDSSAICKIDEMVFESQEKEPWTIDIPKIYIKDLRPSLMQKIGETLGPISPLVVRHMTISDLKGVLSETSTYTATGNLHFINSFKRESSILDLPVNVLSRIVGLDLELMIPVTGDLVFDLKDNHFNLLSLTNAYSEGQRSEFFLEMNPPPSMDLDGNLNIYIKMKQFVLLKITESFLISIDGKLEDPQFRLTKKRFFGLL